MNLEDLEKLATLFGKLEIDMRSLELLLRAALLQYSNDSPTNWQRLDNLQVGDSVAEDELTDFASLRKLINKYNSQIAHNSSEKIDANGEILRIRDALAHGRVYASSQQSPLRIIKFGQSSNGTVAVEFSEEVNEEWLAAKINIVKDELFKVRGVLDTQNP